MKKGAILNPRRSIKKPLIIILAICVALLLLVALVLWLVLGDPFPKTDKGIENYNTVISEFFERKDRKMMLGLMCFPEKLPESVNMDQGEFYATYANTWDPIGKIYLKCDYSDEDFAIEIDRLMHEKSFGALKQDDGSLFSFPAYYAVAGDYGRYEYALITGKNQIVYVALGGWKNTKKIPSEYLPRNYNAKAHEKDQAHYYSAYDEYANGTGRIDYSRKKDQTMPKYYYVKTSEDSFFLLRTEKNASGKEEIARCVFGRKGNANNMEENEIDELKALTGKEFTAVKETDGVINISYVVDGHEETTKYASKN